MNQLIKGCFDPQAAIESGGGVWESGELPPLPDDFELPDTPADIDEVDGDDNGEPGFGDDRGFGNDHPRRDT